MYAFVTEFYFFLHLPFENGAVLKNHRVDNKTFGIFPTPRNTSNKIKCAGKFHLQWVYAANENTIESFNYLFGENKL